MSVRLAASFWRGGTSRGLIVRAKDIAGYAPAVRERLLLQALGSPDPDGRQIDGLGGGVSSLSKICIIGQPGEALHDQERVGALPGVAWADDPARSSAYDVVYRFGQVEIREPAISYGATCGNMLSAVACSAITDNILPYTRLFQLSRAALPPADDLAPIPIPIRILSGNSGQVLLAHVLVDQTTLQLYEAPEDEGVSIAGVPGSAAPVELEFPIDGGGLLTAEPQMTIEADGRTVAFSLVDAGLPNIFVEPSSLGLSDDLLKRPAAELDATPGLHDTLERVRVAVAAAHGIECTRPSPKIVLVGRSPAGDADVVVRAVSTGDFHRTVPGTSLSALALAGSIDGTVVARLAGVADRDGLLRVRHPAGVAEARVRTRDGKSAICMTRTAREIMRGHVLVRP